MKHLLTTLLIATIALVYGRSNRHRPARPGTVTYFRPGRHRPAAGLAPEPDTSEIPVFRIQPRALAA